MSKAFRYDSPKEIQKLLESNGLSMNKRFGQNFLLSEGSRAQIIDSMALTEDTVCWEVGPGIGAITHDIIPKVSSLTVFEIDKGFIVLLKEFFGDESDFSIIEGDVLKNWPNYWKAHQSPDVICGNLPYNIGAQTIASFIEKECLVPTMVFTLQKEVVQRMCAPSGSKQYSAFSVLCSLDYHVEHLFDIQPGAFFPVPDVTSAVVRMKRRETPLLASEKRVDFLKMVHRMFSSRRKTILNNLSGISDLSKSDISEILTDGGYDPGIRAERLSIDQMLGIFTLLEKKPIQE